MSRLRSVIHEVHRRSLWQVLGIYLASAWFCYEIIDAITDRLALPGWLPVLAIILFLLGLPFVVATAFIREETPRAPRPATEAGLPEAEAAAIEVEVAAARKEAGRRHRFLTWRSAGLSFMAALAVWGVVAAVLLLVGVGGSAAGDTGKSVAVLPFTNMSGDPDSEYFSDGITDDIITQLAKIADLKVISRTSVMQYKGSERPLREIAEELGVAAILEGGVRRVGDRVRINAQLINAKSDAHLWAETYDRELTDIFTIQSDVAQKIARELRSTLTPVERQRIQARPTENVEAYDLYVEGRFHWNQRSGEGMRRAIELFEQAIALDSLYALAYAGLAAAYVTLYSWDWMTWEDAVPRIDRALQRALALDPLLGEVHTTHAVYLGQQLDWEGAERAFVRALELAPGYATAHHWHGLLLSKLGRFDEALAEIRRAAELDPLSWIISTNLGWVLYFARDYEAAIDQLERTLEKGPDVPTYPWHLLAEAYADAGRYPEALAAARRALEIGTGPTDLLRAAYVYEKAGDHAEASRILADQGEIGDPTRVALVYVAAGDRERAFQWLERALDERSPFLSELKVEPRYDPIRSDPRFAAALRRLGLE